jgi:hypothetical protein
MDDMLSSLKRYVEEHDYTLANLEADWRSEEHAPWTHELEEITGYVLRACEEPDTFRARDDIFTWLPIVERYWKHHPAYPSLRDALLARLAQIDEASSRALAAERDEHQQAMREWMGARAWADREISELRLREV